MNSIRSRLATALNQIALFALAVHLMATASAATPSTNIVDYYNLQMPQLGDHNLHILSPTNLELILIDTAQPLTNTLEAPNEQWVFVEPAETWNFIGTNGVFTTPPPGNFTVTVNGLQQTVHATGFKRRPFYAPNHNRDLRVQNCIYLQLTSAIADNSTVTVTSPVGGQPLSGNMTFSATVDPMRYSPAIHVNQEGYNTNSVKKADVGYYLGSLGEMQIPTAGGFQIISLADGQSKFSGTLTLHPDVGFPSPIPYQQVYEADFSTFTTPGKYQLKIPGLGASLPFSIDGGIAMDFARAYALGIYHQYCGNIPFSPNAVAWPYTRFQHGVCHSNPVYIPTPDTDPNFNFAWYGGGGIVNSSTNVLHPDYVTGPAITNLASLLYPYHNSATIDVSGGLHDAGDYSKYTINAAHFVHFLVFACDSLPGVSNFDNLGIPGSSTGTADVLDMAKQEADFLMKMQESYSGGFYFLVYPRDEIYEFGPPDSGIPQIVWPKQTAATAAAVAALAEIASSPKFKTYAPTTASNYLAAAQKGWLWLTNQFHLQGTNTSYQQLNNFGDLFTHTDEVAWAACELFLATTNQYYFKEMTNTWLKNPNDPNTFKWGWQEMTEGFGNAIRSYAFGVKSGRVPASALNSAYLGKCNTEITNWANSMFYYSQSNAYGTSFPIQGKGYPAGWYFPAAQAFDLAVGYQLNPDMNYINAMVRNMDYEGGCNPVNVSFVTGLGRKRQRDTVNQYQQYGNRPSRLLPPSGIPLGAIQTGFDTFLQNYSFDVQEDTPAPPHVVGASELVDLTYPGQSDPTNYPSYDRWGDNFNVATEFDLLIQARGVAAYAYLASFLSPGYKNQIYYDKPGHIYVANPVYGQQVTAQVVVDSAVDADLNNSRLVLEVCGQEPVLFTNLVFVNGTNNSVTFTPMYNMNQWIEFELQMVDGRRSFGTNSFNTASAANVVWIDDKLPPGALDLNVKTMTNGNVVTEYFWFWTGTNTFSGGAAHITSPYPNVEQESEFTTPTPTLSIGASDYIYTWIWIDPSQAPPDEVALYFYDETGSANHVAYWGQDKILKSNTVRHSEGAVPNPGVWAKLTIPAGDISLGNHSLKGMGFALSNGNAIWDLTGKSNSP